MKGICLPAKNDASSAPTAGAAVAAAPRKIAPRNRGAAKGPTTTASRRLCDDRMPPLYGAVTGRTRRRFACRHILAAPSLTVALHKLCAPGPSMDVVQSPIRNFHTLVQRDRVHGSL